MARASTPPRGTMRRALTLPTPSSTVLYVCDVQERFRPLIWRFPALVASVRTLCRAAALLDVRTVVTEQNPARLGATVAEVAGALPPAARVFSKMKFSMVTEEVARHAAQPEHAILCGIEAHVCVQQTALELLRAGTQVHLVVDAVSSQRQGDRAVALANLVAAGAAVTTTEAVVFQLLGDAAHPRFKDVQRVVIEHNDAARALAPNLDCLA